jgi:hypothetical protein
VATRPLDAGNICLFVNKLNVCTALLPFYQACLGVWGLMSASGDLMNG